MISVITSTKNQILGALVTKGKTFTSFALERGFKPRSVQKFVDRYAGTGKAPRGATFQRILQALDETLQQES